MSLLTFSASHRRPASDPPASSDASVVQAHDNTATPRHYVGLWRRVEHLDGGQPRLAGERIREVKEEPGRKTGRGTGADSLTR